MTKEVENYEQIGQIAKEDVDILRNKGSAYGRSWIKRGGVGAFMMLARKWDRLETQVAKNGYDIFATIRDNRGGADDILDDIKDLRAYLLLVESHIMAPTTGPAFPAPAPLAKSPFPDSVVARSAVTQNVVEDLRDQFDDDIPF